jgi:hypothetical protein
MKTIEMNQNTNSMYKLMGAFEFSSMSFKTQMFPKFVQELAK